MKAYSTRWRQGFEGEAISFGAHQIGYRPTMFCRTTPGNHNSLEFAAAEDGGRDRIARFPDAVLKFSPDRKFELASVLLSLETGS